MSAEHRTGDLPSPPDVPRSLEAAVANAVARFGREARAKLAGDGEPEDQLRSPLEALLNSVAAALGLRLVPIGESSLADLRVRPDYAVQVDGAVCGYVEVKAPGKGADPGAWPANSHDRKQWEKLRALPNLLYTDGNDWALYRGGQRVGELTHLNGDVRGSGTALSPPDGTLARTLTAFLRWSPVPPRTLDQLVGSVAGLCRLLRDEVVDALARERGGDGSTPFNDLAADWRQLLFPDADDAQFADGYAQTVTFALLLARVEGIDLATHALPEVARQLGKEHSLMGKALSVLTDESLGDLSVTLGTLLRVVSVVDWVRFETAKDPYLYLYERFLEAYDPALRKKTGSYYTPVEVVDNMVRLVDQLLRGRLDQPLGFASGPVVVVDPAMGTGTFLLSILEHAADAVEEDEGREAVPARLREMAARVIGFEKQVGPYAVAELRGYESLRRHGAEPPTGGMRLYVADTLDDPYAEGGHIFAALEPIARSRRAANKVKRDEPVMVVIGNPPYRDKAKGLGGWIERGNPAATQTPPMDAFRAPGNGRYEKTMSNLATFFWRWATWKAYDAHPDAPAGVVALITTGGYLSGPGFRGMREYLRRHADEGWIIDLTPEGHQPPVPTRVFPEVQQPLAIGIFARYGTGEPETPATVGYRSIHGSQPQKFARLAEVTLLDGEWEATPSGWQDPYLPADKAGWGSWPLLGDLLPWRTGGVHQQRSWVNAPDADTLRKRWRRLIEAPETTKPALLKETDSRTVASTPPPLPGAPATGPIVDENAAEPRLVRYAFRSFDRQWLIADSRVIDRPSRLWRASGDYQVWVTELHADVVSGGPAITFAAHIPNLDHYDGRGGRVLPLYRDPASRDPNVAPGLLQHLGVVLGSAVTVEDLLAYVAAVTAQPGFSEAFAEELGTPGIRVPLTASSEVWESAVHLGREVLWLHSFGERFSDPAAGRQPTPRLPTGQQPKVLVGIPDDVERMPDAVDYNAASATLHVGEGRVAPVAPAVWEYRVSDLRVVRHWFGYRRRKPTGRRSSALNDITAERWTPDTTTELLALLNVLGLLVALEPRQEELLERVLASPTVTVAELKAAAVLPVPPAARLAPSAGAAPGNQESLL